MAYKFKITINSAQVSGTSHTNFPYYFSNDITTIPASFWGHVGQVSGSDILFFNSSETTQLKSEIVYFDKDTQSIEAWVQIPTLVNSSNTEIWCYYGGSTKTNDKSMWNDLGARGVYHHQSTADSTSNEFNVTLNSVTTGAVGKIKNAFSYSTAYWESSGLGANAASDNQGSITAWVYRNTNTTNDTILSIEYAPEYNFKHLYFQVRGDRYVGFTHRISATASHENLRQARGSTLINVSTWTHVALTSDGSLYRMYVNGVLQTLSWDWGGAYADGRWMADFPNPATRARSGYARAGSTNLYLNGRLDEVRLINTPLSQTWIQTEVSNQNLPNTFSTAGIEMAASYGMDSENINIVWIPGLL
jgi:hypothetical protein